MEISQSILNDIIRQISDKHEYLNIKSQKDETTLLRTLLNTMQKELNTLKEESQKNEDNFKKR